MIFWDVCRNWDTPVQGLWPLGPWGRGEGLKVKGPGSASRGVLSCGGTTGHMPQVRHTPYYSHRSFLQNQVQPASLINCFLFICFVSCRVKARLLSAPLCCDWSALSPPTPREAAGLGEAGLLHCSPAHRGLTSRCEVKPEALLRGVLSGGHAPWGGRSDM